MLKLDNISKRFTDNAPLLQHVSFALEQGESLAIMGASGSGKSTLLNIVAGLITPTTGSVVYNDKVMSDLPEHKRDAFRASNYGMVFQQFNLIDCLNVEDNISLPARYLKRPVEPRLTQLIEQLGIHALRKQSVDKLSGGEQQRVAIARALIHSPTLILADEPTGNLDEATSERVSDLLFNSARHSNTSLVVVTHAQEVAKKADKILHLKKGTLV